MTTLAAAGGQAASETDKPGPIALLIVVALGIAVYFLGRSMLRHLRSLPPSFSDSNTADSGEIKSEADDESSSNSRG